MGPARTVSTSVTTDRRICREFAGTPANVRANQRKFRENSTIYGRRPFGTGVAQALPVQMVAEAAPAPTNALQVRVVGPEAACLSPTDLRRLFRGRRLTPARRERLRNSGRVLAQCGSRTVGLAAYERVDGELRVHEFGVDESTPCTVDQVATLLLDALEVACLAGGGRRLVLLPRASLKAHLLRSRGFVPIAEGCAGSWFEKLFLS
jgi:hypothetical protein